MLKPFDKWVLKVEKSHVSLEFAFNTPDGLNDFYEVFRDAIINDDEKVKVEIYAKKKEEE